MKKLFLLLAILVFAVSCSAQTGQEAPDVVEEPGEIVEEVEEEEAEEELKIGNKVGNLAPDFELDTLDGGSVKLSDLRGQPVHMVFWSVDCVYCVKELPHVQKVYDENKDDYTALAMNITLQDGEKTARDFIEEEGYDFPVVLIENTKEGLTAMQDYEVRGIPLNVFLDSEGVIAYSVPGMMEEEQLRGVLKELVD